MCSVDRQGLEVGCGERLRRTSASWLRGTGFVMGWTWLASIELVARCLKLQKATRYRTFGHLQSIGSQGQRRSAGEWLFERPYMQDWLSNIKSYMQGNTAMRDG